MQPSLCQRGDLRNCFMLSVRRCSGRYERYCLGFGSDIRSEEAAAKGLPNRLVVSAYGHGDCSMCVLRAPMHSSMSCLGTLSSMLECCGGLA